MLSKLFKVAACGDVVKAGILRTRPCDARYEETRASGSSALLHGIWGPEESEGEGLETYRDLLDIEDT